MLGTRGRKLLRGAGGSYPQTSMQAAEWFGIPTGLHLCPFSGQPQCDVLAWHNAKVNSIVGPQSCPIRLLRR